MKIVALVPSRLNSERIPEKNIQKLGALPLVNYCLFSLSKVPEIDDVILYASDNEIEKSILLKTSYKFIKRPKYLDDGNIQDILKEFFKQVEADIIVLHHITSPFIKPETTSECIDKVVSKKYDSAFTALKIQEFCWYKDKPLNYKLEIPKTQNLEPILVETGLYIFTRKVFEKTGKRIGYYPYIKEVTNVEAIDIDTEQDFHFAKLVLDGLNEERQTLRNSNT